VPHGLNETSAVVTGASSGIGRAIAIALADAGVTRLVVHYRANRSGAERTIESCRRLGCQATACQADLSLEADRQCLVERAFEGLGEIQTWVNNAGADVLTGDAATLNFAAKLRRLMDVDVVGTIHLSRLVAERLVGQAERLGGQACGGERGSAPASLIFIGWDQAPLGMEGDAGQMFAPVKAAVMAFAASLAQSVAPHIRVNTIAPGWIQTSWGDSTSQYWHDRAKSQSLMGRWGQPADVARAVIYAADPENTFLTGQTITLNGGWNRRYGD
jgi:3-oxoacyl-[acyl-carrier protein] reductase